MADLNTDKSLAENMENNELVRVRITFWIVESHIFALLIIPLSVLAAIMLGHNFGLSKVALQLVGPITWVIVICFGVAVHKWIEYRYLTEIHRMAECLWRIGWFSRFVGIHDRSPWGSKRFLTLILILVLVVLIDEFAWSMVSWPSSFETVLDEMDYQFYGLTLGRLLLAYDLTMLLFARVAGRKRQA